MSRYSKTERIGVNATERIVLDELGWIFREQLIVDVGIDAHMELVDNGVPTGKLVALQIKTGESHFHETETSFTYYGNQVHLDYWLNHSLPVLLVAHMPECNQTLWTLIDKSSVVLANKSRKISIPKTRVFGRETAVELASTFEGSRYEQRLRKLSIDEPLMRHMVNGGKVSLELEDWINKSMGRTPVRVFIYDKNGNETLDQDWFQYYVGYEIKELAETLFPWASAVVDEEFYEEHYDNGFDWHEALMRATDEDNGLVPEVEESETIYPYEETGEVEFYRLQLELNELGKAYLAVADHLSECK